MQSNNDEKKYRFFDPFTGEAPLKFNPFFQFYVIFAGVLSSPRLKKLCYPTDERPLRAYSIFQQQRMDNQPGQIRPNRKRYSFILFPLEKYTKYIKIIL